MAIDYRTPILPLPLWRQLQFWEKVNKADDSQCWNWQGCKTDRNYGTLSVRRKIVRAHRVAFAITSSIEPINDILHTCDNPPCCNPAHLYEGTPKDNARDKQTRGRTPKGFNGHGEEKANAKLTWEAVDYIRTNYGSMVSVNRAQELAKMFGVARTTISSVVHGKSWTVRPEQ